MNDIADRAKHWYARARLSLAAIQYRIAELAGTGRLRPDETEDLQLKLIDVYWSLHFGTVDAVLDMDYLEAAEKLEDEEVAHNTYTDGRPVTLQTRIEPVDESDFNWEHNRFLFDDGAIIFHPRGTTCSVLPIDPGDDRGWTGASF